MSKIHLRCTHLKIDEPYYIAFFLVGAYQEALGNNHNLFGAVNELIIRLDAEGDIISLDEVKGESCGDILHIMNYKDEEIISGYERQLKRSFDNKHISLETLSHSKKNEIILPGISLFITKKFFRNC